MNNDPIRIYRYLPHQFAIDSLERGVLKVGRLGALNDPFDAAPRVVTSSGKNADHQEVDSHLQKWNDRIGIISFSLNPRGALLWSHYGEAHRGIVLGFDYYPNPLGQSLVRVNYDDKRPEVLLRDLDFNADTIERHFNAAFSTKSTEWKHEEEVRMMVFLSDCKTSQGAYFLPMDCGHHKNLTLKEVILGAKCPTSTAYIRHCIHKAYDWSGGGVRRAKISVESYGID